MSVSAQEWQVVGDGDIYELARLLYDSGDGFEIIAAIFGDENVWGGLPSDMKTAQRRQLAFNICILLLLVFYVFLCLHLTHSKQQRPLKQHSLFFDSHAQHSFHFFPSQRGPPSLFCLFNFTS